LEERAMPASPTLTAAAVLAALAAALPAHASEEAEAAEAMQRMLDSQAAVLDTLEAIEDAESLERNRAALSEALARARSDADALADHAETIASATALQAVLRPRIVAHNARRRAVHADIAARLDPATLDRLDEIFDAAE
jgi:hypothetical protein